MYVPQGNNVGEEEGVGHLISEVGEKTHASGESKRPAPEMMRVVMKHFLRGLNQK